PLDPLLRSEADREWRGARQLLEREPGGAHLGLERLHALEVDVLDRRAEHLDVAAVPVRGHEDADRERPYLAQEIGHRVLALPVLLDEVGEALHAEPDVPLP